MVMKISDAPILPRTSASSGAVIDGVCLAIAAAVILPNLFLFSVDDIMIVSFVDPLRTIALEQGPNGRYSLAALCWLLRVLGGTRIDLEIVGALTIIAGFAALFRTTTRLMKASFAPVDFVLAFTVFMTFGLLMDVFSFTNVWVQSGAGSIALAGALRIAVSQVSILKKVLATALFGWIAMGFYQTFPYMVACSLLAAFVGALAFRDSISCKEIWNEYVPVALGSVLAIALYLLTNKVLNVAGVHGFEVNARPAGAEYIRANLLPYFKTLRETLDPFDGSYARFLSKIAIAIFVLGLVTIVWKSSRIQTKGWLITAIGLTVLMLPNPTNLLVKYYWPAPRSLSPIAIFVALALLAAAARWTKTIGGVSIGRWLLLVAVVTQGIVYIDQLKGRLDQQISDFAMANAIIDRAYEEFGPNEAPKVKINFDWRDNLTYRPVSYEFGSSLFGSTWSLQGLFAYLSNRKVEAILASPDDCAMRDKQLAMKRVGDALLVCSTK